MNQHVLISGCSGGGKSALLAELARRGHRVVEEPGRRIVREELDRGGSALPWIDLEAFARRAIAMALQDRDIVADAPGWVFYDRGFIDAAAALQHITGDTALDRLANVHRYHDRVFLAPPWPAIYRTDPERRHGFEEAVAEYERLALVYPRLRYEVILLPQVGIAARADFVMATLGA